MRFVSGIALFAALMSTLLPPAFAAPAQQTVDAQAILGASAQIMDAAQSMSFSGTMDMSISKGGSPTAMSMPMSGAYQAPDRMTMTVQMPEMNTSRDMVMVGGQVWTRTGRGPWTAAPARDGYASPLGRSHAEWVGGLMNPIATDLGDAYRVSASMDVSDALSAGYTGAAGPGRSRADFSGSSAQVALTIDKATNYMISMRMDLVMPMPEYSASMNLTMSMTFADFNSMAVDILPPV